MNVDDDAEHAWLAREDAILRRLVERRVPLFAVCLGAQTLAKASGAHVGPLPAPEEGFVEVELTPGAADDPIFSQLPQRFDALNLHRYAFEVPTGAIELARSSVCAQALRVGECAWGVQFHPEVRLGQVEAWLGSDVRSRHSDDVERLRRELADGIAAWTDFGTHLCGSFLETADRLVAGRYSPR